MELSIRNPGPHPPATIHPAVPALATRWSCGAAPLCGEPVPGCQNPTYNLCFGSFLSLGMEEANT